MTRRIQILLDLIVLICAFVFSYLARSEFTLPPLSIRIAIVQLLFVVLIQFAALRLVGAHKFLWQYVGMTELKSFFYAALLSALPLLPLSLVAKRAVALISVPLSIIIIDTCFAFGGALLLRIATRAAHERREWNTTASKAIKKAILLIGAGQAGVMVVRELRARAESHLQIRGFIDDDPRKQKTRIQGIDVLGTTKDIPRLVRELEIDHVIITIARGSRDEIRRIVNICKAIPIHLRIMPALYEIIQGNVEISRFREVQIEDLLGRDTVKLDESGIGQYVTDGTIMVTGAGGFIGAELARQIQRYHPAKLLLVDRAEPALFTVHRQLTADQRASTVIVPVLADINDDRRMRSVFQEFQPDIVFHAAAHKHVPMSESNPAEAIWNNVLATKTIGEFAGEFGVDVFVLISTDKAVNPTSVMGASKRVAELVAQDLNLRFAQTRYLAVRFGNVIGSTGSVITIFQEQIRKRQPVTVTDKRMQRYFMTVSEAVQLVLQAGSLGRGGEIFTLEMGSPVRIYDLACDMILSQGLKPGEDIEIQITGVRPGEKLFEELRSSGESHDLTRHPKILVSKIQAPAPERVAGALGRLTDLIEQGGETAIEIRRLLNALLPEARLEIPSENGSVGGNHHEEYQKKAAALQ